jgi:ABC-type branched-subunit amino acid transport system substrate-binding protein
MNRMGNGLLQILLFVFLTAFFLAFPAWAKDAGPIKIGFIAPLSGPLAQLGKDAENGAKLYLE